MHYNLYKLKLYLLQKKYSSICEIITKLQDHINLLLKNNLIEYSKRMIIFNELFEITKVLNTQYNDYVNNESFGNNNLESSGMNELIEDTETFSHIYDLNRYIISENKDKCIFPIAEPLENYSKKVIDIISDIGLGTINDTIFYYLGKERLNIIVDENKELFKELKESTICTGIQIFTNNLKEKNFLITNPSEFADYDVLNNTRELYIKLTDKSMIKLNLIFKIDYLSINLKSSQINLPILYNKKTDIINLLKEENIDIKFGKLFIRYDYIGNIYSMSTEEYVNYIKKSHEKFINISNQSILNLMKDFLSKTVNIKDMFEIIFLLLLGDSDNHDIAGILLGLLKEKKSQLKNIYNLIHDNLSFYLQSKIKKSVISLKDQAEKLKKINIDNIDYSKQLITNKNIPDNIKSLTMEKIEEMKSNNNEYFKQLTYVKHILNYPWSSDSEDHIYKLLKNNEKKAREYIEKTETKLRESSYGHEEAKSSLLQIIGKWISNPSSQGTSFGLVGPPGVGKTLLAKSLSESLDIPFAQITLGGQNDGEILHGHGYTYSGSQPGMIVKKMVEMGKSRCILYFDELDKTCSKHGQINEISSILIHLTDPNMNKSFQDRFFQGIDFPLDKVIMMFSYNDSSLVDPILLDRIKEINITPYSLKDKIEIVNNFIIPELSKNIGLEDIKIDISDDMIEYIVENYTQEAGVREIKRKIEEILLNINLDKIYKRGLFKKNIKVVKLDKKVINNILKDGMDNDVNIHEKDTVGIINGLYATANGSGGIVPIQVFKNLNFGNTNGSNSELLLTGSLGDTMKESVSCSLTCAKQYLIRNYEKLNNTFLDKSKKESLEEYLCRTFNSGFHVHTPSTATPKDGPSAGCAFTSAFISRILNKPIRKDIAMTGEIELTGKVTKIGGLIYKLIGAKKAGVKLVFVSLENKKDLDEIKEKHPKLINKNFVVKLITYIDDFIDQVLVN